MKALDYILSHCGSYKNYGKSHEKIVFKSLLYTLEKDELTLLDKKLKQRYDFIVDKLGFEEERAVIRSIRRTVELIKENTIKGKNESISTLLKLFVNKKSGRVCEVRKKLQSRYDYQSYQIQGKILKAFLHSSQADRKWAYKCLLKQWHSTLGKDVLDLWEKYHEDECAIVVIKYASENYLLVHQDEFRNHYTDLCIRLIKNPAFVMRKEWVNHFTCGGDIDVLYVNARADNPVPGIDVLKVLFQWIIITINSTNNKYIEENSSVLEYNKEGQALYFSTKYAQYVTDIIWCMRKLKMVDEIIYYLEWDKKVQEKFANKILEQDFKDIESDYVYYLWKTRNIFYETVLEELPQEFCYLKDELKDKTFDDFWSYPNPLEDVGMMTPELAKIDRQGSIKEFSEKNPVILKMIKMLDLQKSNEPF